MTKILCVAGVLTISGCATAPHSINNVCAVFEQQDGWFNDWHSSARAASRKYGIPVPILMATIRKESGFRSNAKPPRKQLLGFIPWKRPSSAYGSRRANFADAVDFVGWYHAKTVSKYGVAPNDAFNLYLAYYSGWGGYGRGSWRSNAGLQRTARETAEMAQSYATQLDSCR